MTTITRQQLRDAIEAGISGAASAEGFTAQSAARLRVVAAQAAVVARGDYEAPISGGGCVRCPVAAAYPRYWKRLKWGGSFALFFDGATHSYAAGHTVLHITDDNPTEGEGA